MAHHARTMPHAASQDWIMDSGATHHITNALDNLHLNHPYHGRDELLVGDGIGLPITCQTNPIFVEFFYDYFLVKDLKTRVTLIKGHHK